MFLYLLACDLNTETPDTDADADTDTDADTDADTDSDTDADTDTDTEAAAAVRQAARADVRAANASGATVAVWKDGAIVYSEAFGTRHPDTDEAVATTTLFQIGSDTKKMTAILALQKVADGELSLDDTLADVVPELVFADDAALADSLTLHELLSHQSGMYDYTPWTDNPDDTFLYDHSVGDFAAGQYQPGTSGLYFNYCNPNFSLAGLMTEQVDDRAWADIAEQDLFAPLGLTRTYARMTEVVADGDYAIGNGYTIADDDAFDIFDEPTYTFGANDAIDNAFIRPAGMVWSTAEDMANFGGFLIDGNTDVLSDDLRQQITTGHVGLYPNVAADAYGYGYGMFVANGWSGYNGYYDGVPLWSHGGNTLTMTSTFYLLPEQRVVVAILSNGYGDDFTATAVTAMEAYAELPTPLDTAPELLGPAGTGEELAGTWYDPHMGTLILTWDGEALNAEAPDLDAAGVVVGSELRPLYEDVYLIRAEGADYDLSYYVGDDGTEYLINRAFAWKRSSGLAPRPVVTGAHLAAPDIDLREHVRGLGR